MAGNSRQPRSKRAGVGKYAERPGAEAYDNVSKWSKGVIRWGRRCGALFAFLIVVGLFAIADGTPINGLGATAVFLSVTPLPLTLVLVYAIYWMFLAWLTVRNLKSFFAFWTLMFRLARKLR